MEAFQLFSSIHIITILVVVISSISVPLFCKTVFNSNNNINISYFIGFILITHELIKPFYRYEFYNDPIIEILPLHMCHLASLSMGLFFFTKKNIFFEVGYFWGMTGNIMAIFTPDLNFFFDWRYFTYFFGHNMLLLSIIFSLVCLRHDINFSSIMRVSSITLTCLPLIYFLNTMLGDGANYWYLNAIPESTSILSLLPSPPLHIMFLIPIGILLMFVVYAPYRYLKNT
jgi:hypothetical integral membrane protein (TIGR02206 family)|tara:strand:- start:498 stop:1184 length:687 start_codon:yes stop_codon:yes gene_type:complete